MSTYDVFENLNFLCDGVEAQQSKELEWQLEDDSSDFNFSQEEQQIVKEKVNKKENTKTKAKSPVPALKSKRRKRLTINDAATVLPVLQPSQELEEQPCSRKTRNSRNQGTVSSTPPPVNVSTRKRRNKRNKQVSNIIQPLNNQRNIHMEIQAALQKCAAASASGTGRAIVRSRNRILSQAVSHSRTKDVIDLVSSSTVPVPVAVAVQGLINLDSDDEETFKKSTNDAYYDQENLELEVKVMWNDNIETYKLRKYQKFVHLIKQISEAHDCPANKIVCNLDDHIIHEDDDAASLNLKLYHIIYAREFSSEMTPTKFVEQDKNQHNANQIKVKILSEKFRAPMEVSIMKSDKFIVLYVKCAEKLLLSRSNIKLSYDGDDLPVDGTPEMLDIMDGDTVDLRVID